MNQYDNTNKGALFVNERKDTDKHPDWKGSLNINGVEHWISGWARSTARGDVISLALGEPKQQAAAQAAAQARPQWKPQAAQQRQPQKAAPSGFDDLDSDVPW